RGNAAGGARLLRRGAAGLAGWSGEAPAGLDVEGLVRWAGALARRVETSAPVDPARHAPRLTGVTGPAPPECADPPPG
ncbi:hypothetical protein GTW43_01805, partial [Streptomyces sp. SID5785]|nr:hypothetical protein [Streptomyces sp. SID5785]